jgi:alkanesulfonate monooxygenase SsuD/methylene tetrahydromethanopterin reductase-like flavin-dependent oxidoreductase (luciferase family)
MRPAPRSQDWEDRTLCVGMSPTSAIEAAKLGARLMSFANGPWEKYRETHLAPYLATFRENHSRAPGPLVLAENVIVHEDRERAYEIATEYFGNYFQSVREFYQTGGSHIQTAKGYEAYAAAAKIVAEIPEEVLRKGYVDMSLHGTPADILEKLRERRRVLGHPFDMCALIDVGDMPFSIAERCVRLIGEAIIPVVHQWDRDFNTEAALAPAAE